MHCKEFDQHPSVALHSTTFIDFSHQHHIILYHFISYHALETHFSRKIKILTHNFTHIIFHTFRNDGSRSPTRAGRKH